MSSRYVLYICWNIPTIWTMSSPQHMQIHLIFNYLEAIPCTGALRIPEESQIFTRVWWTHSNGSSICYWNIFSSIVRICGEVHGWGYFYYSNFVCIADVFLVWNNGTAFICAHISFIIMYAECAPCSVAVRLVTCR